MAAAIPTVAAEASNSTKVVMDANDVTTVINNINSLYSNALDQIITLTIGLLTLGGVVLPLIVAYFQRKQSKAEEKALTELIAKEVLEAKDLLITNLQNQLTTELAIFEKKTSDIKNELIEVIRQQTSGVNAKAHHAQAIRLIAAHNFETAYMDCMVAIEDYCTAKDERNLRVILDVLIPQVLPKLNKSTFKNNEKMERALTSALAAINEHNMNGRYDQNIESIKLGINEAKERQS